MSRRKRYIPFILGAASTLGITWLIRRRSQESDSLSTWLPFFIRRYGAEKAQRLYSAVQKQHTDLVAQTPVPENQALRWHLRENILPGLALYRVLLREQGSQVAALAEIDEVFRLRTLAKYRMQFAILKRMPEPFGLFRLAFAQVMKQFPPEGWDIAYAGNGGEKVALNITRCFYLNTLTALGAPELTASFCKNDDVMAELLPTSIRFVRPHTLGRGDAVCDFQYCRVDTA